MKTYTCTGAVVGGKYLGTVEAESPEEALGKAQALPSIGVSLCYACADEVTDPEIDRIYLECDGEDVTPPDDAEAELTRLRAANAELVDLIEQMAPLCIDVELHVVAMRTIRRITQQAEKRPSLDMTQAEWTDEERKRFEQAEQKPETCVWDDNNGQTECGAIPHGELLAQMDSLTFCPFCGKRIEVKK